MNEGRLLGQAMRREKQHVGKSAAAEEVLTKYLAAKWSRYHRHCSWWLGGHRITTAVPGRKNSMFAPPAPNSTTTTASVLPLPPPPWCAPISTAGSHSAVRLRSTCPPSGVGACTVDPRTYAFSTVFKPAATCEEVVLLLLMRNKIPQGVARADQLIEAVAGKHLR